MKILYLITKSTAGGAQTHVLQLCTFLQKQGHEVAVMAQSGGWLEEEIGKIGATFYTNNYFQNSYNPMLGLKARKQIKTVAQQWKPDIISCHSTIAGFWGRLAIKNTIPTVFTAHGWGFTPGVPKIRSYLTKVAEKIVASYASTIICVSKFDKQLAKNNGIDTYTSVQVVYNGVEIYSLKKEKKSVRLPINITYIGRMDAQKDPYTLLYAIQNIKNKYGEIWLTKHITVRLIGGGPLLENIKKYIKEEELSCAVECLGNIKRKNVLEILENKTDLFVLTSHWEGFPRSILEAMSTANPIIATNVGGVSEVVNSAVGWCIAEEDTATLESILYECIQNPLIIEKKGMQARKVVEEQFSLEKMCTETVEIYKKTVKTK